MVEFRRTSDLTSVQSSTAMAVIRRWILTLVKDRVCYRLKCSDSFQADVICVPACECLKLSYIKWESRFL